MIHYEEKRLSPKEFNYLTTSVGWEDREENIIEEALKNSLYSICAYEDDEIIGFGRIIGDKTIFLYIQDIMVVPNYQSQRIGSSIIKRILDKVNEFKKVNPNIRTYLGASKGKENFYKKFGFVTRTEADLGEGMILK